MRTDDAGCPVMRYLGWGILTVIVGVPGLLFVVGMTLGAISAPVVGLLFVAPFVAAYSILWAPWLGGRAFPERSPNEAAANQETAPKTS
jgi:hypothetical protein